RLRDLNQEAGALDKKIDELQKQMGSIEESASNLLEQVNQALGEVATEAGTDRAALDSALDDLKTTAEGILEWLEAWGQGPLVTVIGEATTALDELKDYINDRIHQTEDAKRSLEASLDAVEKGLAAGREKLQETAQDVLDAKGGELQQKLGSFQSLLQTNQNSVMEHVNQAKTQVTDELGALFKGAAAVRDVLSGGVQKVAHDILESTVSKATEDITTHVQAEVVDPITNTIKEVVESFASMGENLLGKKDEQEGVRALVEPLIDEMDGLIDPLKSAVDSVKSAADKVGIDL
ncbi:MAG TPA: hypothetical protein VFM29_02335, partial [Vicinamibacteria bacterium]|nr:hypothetical protein [Vicinamibacteria bacterium]